jgi:hypothetical protein
MQHQLNDDCLVRYGSDFVHRLSPPDGRNSSGHLPYSNADRRQQGRFIVDQSLEPYLGGRGRIVESVGMFSAAPTRADSDCGVGRPVRPRQDYRQKRIVI